MTVTDGHTPEALGKYTAFKDGVEARADELAAEYADVQVPDATDADIVLEHSDPLEDQNLRHGPLSVEELERAKRVKAMLGSSSVEPEIEVEAEAAVDTTSNGRDRGDGTSVKINKSKAERDAERAEVQRIAEETREALRLAKLRDPYKHVKMSR